VTREHHGDPYIAPRRVECLEIDDLRESPKSVAIGPVEEGSVWQARFSVGESVKSVARSLVGD
jgi:hypothetical protein